uniref:Phosphoinositide-3-kinase adaptor protein 1 n=1 Tax=Leptobrachium leishanense TaxID=445787 RepID=A0A8C5QMT3_9ANUR
MASKGDYDVLIIHGSEAKEWSQYLSSLFETSHHLQHLAVLNYEIHGSDGIQTEDLETFQSSRCILVLLSGELVNEFHNQDFLHKLQIALKPPNKVIILFCGVTDYEDFGEFFDDWSKWKQLSCEDDPEQYLEAVIGRVFEDSGCDSVTDTDAEREEECKIYSTHLECLQEASSPSEKQGNLITIQPDRIRCGEKTQIYIIFKCKLDSQIKNEVYFSLPNGSTSVRLPAQLENEYILSVDAPDLPSGQVFIKVLSGDLKICEATITYFTDMEEISNLLISATNPVEFMCQAFKIVPYNTEILDKLLTESLKNNIPASGLHLFGINQIEEENISANQRDEELPTLLHFSAKYGLKNLTALLLTCPGALQAYSVSNKHGDFPNNIAEKHGYKDLRKFIDEYVETADMLRTHIKEQLMHSGDEEDDNITYESMAKFSTDLLMKCSLNPGCDDELYESMNNFITQFDDESTYVDMQTKGAIPSADMLNITGNDSVIRKILEGGNLDGSEDVEDPYHMCKGEDIYYFVEEGSKNPEVVSRPPVPVPRPAEPLDTEPFILKEPSVRLRRDRPQSSVYDPFVGMKTPGQRELITLQEQVKLKMISVDEALLQFKDWQLNQKKRSDSFRYQQENLTKLRDSINRRRNENKRRGKKSDFEITKPIRRGQNPETKTDCGVYESSPFFYKPPKKDITRGNWKNDSTSSTASSASNRSSTRSTVSSGMEGDNEDNEVSELPKRRNPRYSLTEEKPPPRPPRLQNRNSRSTPPTPGHNFTPPPVPPRGR